MGIPRRELLSSKLDASGIERHLQEPLCVDTSINYELDSAMFPGVNQPGNTQQPVLMIAGHQSVRWDGRTDRREYNQSHSQNNGVYLAQNPTRTKDGCSGNTASNKNLHILRDRQLTQCTDDQLDLIDVNPGDLVCGLKDRSEYLRLVEDVMQGVPSSLELQYTQGPICISDSPPVSPNSHHHSPISLNPHHQPSHPNFLIPHQRPSRPNFFMPPPPSTCTSPTPHHSSSVSGLDSHQVNCSQLVRDESHGTKRLHTKDSAQYHLRVNGRLTGNSGDKFTEFMNERLIGDGFNGPLSRVTNVNPRPQHVQSVMSSVNHVNYIPYSVNSTLHSTNPALQTVKHAARVIPQNHVNHVQHVVKQEPHVNPSFHSVNGVHYSVNHAVQSLNPLPHTMSPAASRPLHPQQDHTSQHQSFCPGDNYSVLSDVTGAGFISAGYASNVMGDASKKRKRVDASTDFQKRACSDYVKFVRNQQVRVM